MLDRLLAALRAEFSDVTLYVAPPKSYTAPSVVVRPGNPFLVPSNHGLVDETWEVLVLVSAAAPDKGVASMRRLSLRIMRAAHSVGARWEGAPEAGRFEDESSAKVALSNTIRFRYSPADFLLEESSSSSSS